ncbi:GH18 family chitinase [Chitinophaga niastensis]|uniref:GH18 family chitinase n=1 Tax=Chitinophaga niastensis TaxID=536980 RepID=A0A2P8HRT9_CHINA|nr:glycosyl hydrolase family 18 protein [Chitinophaga niastensis]PSL48933.1 GH18 family chitinase [Chitinophaga niastensis]
MKAKYYQLLLLFFCLLVTAPATAQHKKTKRKKPKTTTTVQSQQPFRIIGYFSNWGPVSKIKFENITCVNFAFLKPMPDGTILNEKANDKLYDIVAQAKPYHVKVVGALGGQYTDKTFTKITSNESLENTFVDNVMAAVDKYQLDGIDLDWEYPQFNSDEPQKLVILTKKLSDRLHQKGKILSIAIHAKPKWGVLALNDLYPLADYFNIMAYDDMDHPAHSSYDFAVTSLNYWIVDRQLPREKANLGLPTYGRNPKVVPPYYKDLISKGADPDADLFNGVYYNGKGTIKKKVDLALRNVGGIMIWEINGDSDDETTSLIKAMKDETRDYQRSQIKNMANVRSIE